MKGTGEEGVYPSGDLGVIDSVPTSRMVGFKRPSGPPFGGKKKGRYSPDERW